MNRTYTMTIYAFVIALVLGLLGNSLFSADLSSEKTPPLVRDADLSVSPFKGPEDAPVKIVVFTCFQ